VNVIAAYLLLGFLRLKRAIFHHGTLPSVSSCWKNITSHNSYIHLCAPIAPRHATTRRAPPCDDTPRPAMRRHAAPRHATTRRAPPCDHTTRPAMRPHAAPRHATTRRAPPCHGTPRPAMPRHAACEDEHCAALSLMNTNHCLLTCESEPWMNSVPSSQLLSNMTNEVSREKR